MMLVNLSRHSEEHSRHINTLFGKTSLFITFKHVIDTITTLLKGLIPFVFKNGSAGKRGKGVAGALWSGKQSGARLCYMFLSFSAVSLFVDLQVNPFRPIPNHSADDSLPV
jgi:hypothetical protein